jgi:predicted ribosome quality control (RQC) complex YloA/Tae2 family protein
VSADNTNGTPPDVEQLAIAARRRPAREIAKQQRLIANLKGDLTKHGDPEKWRRYGDLLLANVSTAVRRGDVITVTDYFDPDAPQVDIEGDANKPLTEIAEEYFRLYTKARNGLSVINRRMAEAEASVVGLQEQLRRIDEAVEAGDAEFLASLVKPAVKRAPPAKKKKAEAAFKGARRFVSSDGFEILVGKKAADNDYLTFRIARSLDLWLHAADYPGSHVVVRRSGRKEIPHTTLIEAAELAAFYSDARGQGKAAVRYTEKKFVNKPRKGAPGLVSLASFKTIMAVPKISVSSSGFRVPS